MRREYISGYHQTAQPQEVMDNVMKYYDSLSALAQDAVGTPKSYTANIVPLSRKPDSLMRNPVQAALLGEAVSGGTISR